MSNILQNILKHLDLVLAIIGCILGVSLVFVYTNSSTSLIIYIAISLLIISPIYIYCSRKLQITSDFRENRESTWHFSKRTCIISDILFWVAIALSYIILVNSGDTRPISYFIIISLATLFIVTSLFSGEDNLLKSTIEIIKILVLGLNIRLSVYIFRSGNGGSGGDSFLHMKINQILSDVGNLDIMGLQTRVVNKEMSFPLMHIQTAATDLITGLPIKLSTFIAISVPLLISTVCIYLVAKELFNNKTAILATLILSVCDYVILWGFGPTTTSFGLCIFYFSMYCMIKVWKSNSNIIWTSLLFILIISMLFNHAVSTFVMFVSFLAFSLGLSFYNLYINNSKIKISDWIFTIIFGTFCIVKWFYSNYSTSITFFDKISTGLVNRIDSSIGLFKTVASSVFNAGLYEPIITQFISNIGYIILFALSIFGMYLLCNKKNMFKLGTCIIFGYLLLQFVTYIFPILGLRDIIPDRWFAFIWFFASILMAFAIIHLCNIYGKKIICLTYIILLLFTFSMITCPIANDDSPIISKEYRASNSYTFKEVAAGQTIGKYSLKSEVLTDYYYKNIFYFANLDDENADLNYNDILQIKEGSIPENIKGKLLVYRDEMADRGIRVYAQMSDSGKTSIIKTPFGNDFRNNVLKHSKIYDISSVSAHYM